MKERRRCKGKKVVENCTRVNFATVEYFNERCFVLDEREMFYYYPQGANKGGTIHKYAAT